MAAEESVSFAINLESDISSVAKPSAEALENLQTQIQGDIGALREMQKAMRSLQGGSVVNVATMRQLKDQIAGQKAKVAQSTQAFVSLGGVFKAQKKPSQEMNEGLKAVADATRAMPGPLGQLSGRLSALRSVMAGAAAGPVLLGAGLLTLAAAAAVAAGALAVFGIAQADARRSELLHLEGLTKLRYFMGGFAIGVTRSADKASTLQTNLDRVTASVALGRSEVARYQEQLYKMGLRGANLQQALEGVAITASVQGDAQAQMFAQWAAGAALTGQSVRRLADDVRGRLGGIAERQMLSLNVQSTKLHENLEALFRDVKIDGFLRAVQSFVKLFSQSEATGRALKHIIDTLFSGLNGPMQGTSLLVKRFFQGVVIGLLTLEKMLLKVRGWWLKAFGKDLTSGIDLTTVAVYAGVGAVFSLAAALGLVAVSVGLALSPFILIGAAIWAVVEAIKAACHWFAEFYGSAAMVGPGAAAGIESGTDEVTAAAAQLGKDAQLAFDQQMQIMSPSRVMFKSGRHVAGGAALGIKSGLPEMQMSAREITKPLRAVADISGGVRQRANIGGAAEGSPVTAVRATALRMAQPPPAEQRAPKAASGRGNTTITLEYHAAPGAKDPEKEADQIMAALEQKLQDYGIALGATGSD